MYLGRFEISIGPSNRGVGPFGGLFRMKSTREPSVPPCAPSPFIRARHVKFAHPDRPRAPTPDSRGANLGHT